MLDASFQHHLYESREFADVTLVSEDYFSVDVHKTILAYSSSFFKTLLHIGTDQKPLIYLKGVHREELSVMVKLIYLGKASLEYDELQALSEVAEEYQFHQIFSNSNHLKVVDYEQKSNQKLEFLTKSLVTETIPKTCMKSKKLNFLNFDSDQENYFKKEFVDHNVGHTDMLIDNTDYSLEKQNDLELEVPENLDFGGVEGTNLLPENLGVEETNLEEGNPINEVVQAHSTDESKSGSIESQMKMRKKKVEEEPSECNVCAKKFTTLRSLQRHHKSIHELAQIETCTQCEKVFKCKDSLRGHIRALHEPQKFMTCDNCNKKIKGPTPYRLKMHRKNCLNLVCEFCKLKFEEEEEFHLHIKEQHMNKFLA